MKSKSLLALAVAGAFACGSAFAGAGHHHGSMNSEVSTPMSVNESAPWLATQQHSSGWSSHDSQMAVGVHEGQFTDGPVGTSSSTGANGSGGYDSSASHGRDQSSAFGSSSYDSTALSEDSGDTLLITEYWLIGTPDQEMGTGASSSFGGSGAGGFDSSTPMNDSTDSSYEPMSANDYSSSFASLADDPLAVVFTPSAEQIAESYGDSSPFVSEHYLMSKLDSDFVIVVEAGPSPEDIAMLDQLKNDFFVLTPATDDA
jgi:hypothetical protein